MNKIELIIKGEKEVINLDELDYKNGLAISMVMRKHWRYEEDIVYVGVLDEIGNVVLPYQAYYKDIEIFPSKNLIVKVNKGNDDGSVTWTETRHCKYSGSTLEVINDKISSSYEKVSSTVIKTSTTDEDGKKCMVLYDVVIAKIISETFSKIGSFEKRPNGEELACATTTLTIGDNKCSYDIDCYINRSGVIRTPIFNPYSNSIVKLDSSYGYKDAIRKIYDEIKIEELLKSNEKQRALRKFWGI